jgi:hypothetical protein
MQGRSRMHDQQHRQQSLNSSSAGSQSSSLKKSSSQSSPTNQSRYHGIRPPSPPIAVLNVGGHTLIAPNSTLARAIVTGNAGVKYDERGYSISTTTGGNNQSYPSGAESTQTRGHPNTRTVMTDRTSGSGHEYQQETFRPISNLTVLLNQHDNGGIHLGSPGHSYEQSIAVVEADSASGPSPQYVTPLGRSAPDLDHRSLYPPAQLRRQQHRSTAATQLTSDKVRRYVFLLLLLGVGWTRSVCTMSDNCFGCPFYKYILLRLLSFFFAV